MKEQLISKHTIDHVEIYTPMAKALAYWHCQALGFQLVAELGPEHTKTGLCSYVLTSLNIRLVLTSSFPIGKATGPADVSAFIATNYCGVKRFALQVDSVIAAFENSVENGAFPVKYPETIKNDAGYIESAAIKLYDSSEIVFINRNNYTGVFKPGYKQVKNKAQRTPLFSDIDHIASEVRINEGDFWTRYLQNTIGTQLVQTIESGADNLTGMVLKINQSVDKQLTLVIAEPETYQKASKVQANIETFGPGIHHLAFSTDDLFKTVHELIDKDVEFVSFPPSYYALLRQNPDFSDFDIDKLEKWGILIDKEEDSYLLQKFVKPISDRPFFFYEIVQRVNGYEGFALKNINVLKKAEEIEIMNAE